MMAALFHSGDRIGCKAKKMDFFSPYSGGLKILFIYFIIGLLNFDDPRLPDKATLGVPRVYKVFRGLSLLASTPVKTLTHR